MAVPACPCCDQVAIHNNIHDLNRYEIEVTDDLRLSGSEKDLNELLMQDLSMIEPGLKPVNQQQQFRKGVCDIIAEDKEGNLELLFEKLAFDL